MSESTIHGTRTDTATTGYGDLGRAALSGVLAGVVFGLVIQFVLHRMTVVGALYTLGEGNLLVGWAAHMAHSAIFGLVFGVVAWWRPVGDRAATPGGAAAVGAGFAAVLWLVNIVVIWPLWLNAVGVEMLPFPYLAPRPLVGHLVWGALLGALYWALGTE